MNTYAGTGYANPDAVTSIGGTATSTYVNNGNLLTYKAAGSATSTYTWDMRNRLTQSVVNGTTTTYGYDDLNRFFEIMGREQLIINIIS